MSTRRELLEAAERDLTSGSWAFRCAGVGISLTVYKPNPLAPRLVGVFDSPEQGESWAVELHLQALLNTVVLLSWSMPFQDVPRTFHGFLGASDGGGITGTAGPAEGGGAAEQDTDELEWALVPRQRREPGGEADERRRRESQTLLAALRRRRGPTGNAETPRDKPPMWARLGFGAVLLGGFFGLMLVAFFFSDPAGFRADAALKVASALGPLLGVVTGSMATYFFTEQERKVTSARNISLEQNLAVAESELRSAVAGNAAALAMMDDDQRGALRKVLEMTAEPSWASSEGRG